LLRQLNGWGIGQMWADVDRGRGLWYGYGVDDDLGHVTGTPSHLPADRVSRIRLLPPVTSLTRDVHTAEKAADMTGKSDDRGGQKFQR